jgi:hypothetical protein
MGTVHQPIFDSDKQLHMISPEKIKQVQKQLRSGVPQGEIKNQLLAEGYTEEDLANIFIAHKPDMRNWYLVFAILFFLVGLYSIAINGSFLFLLFAAGMFAVYYFEVRRIKGSAKK